MEDVRIGGMFYEQRGPLVFSASIHLVLLVVVAIWLMIAPEKEPEEFKFEIVSAPSGGYAQTPQDQPLEAITYKSEPMDLPSINDIVIPDRKPIVVQVQMPAPKPDPVAPPVPKPQPVAEVVKTQPKPQPTSWEEFQRQNADANEIKSQRTTPAPTPQPRVDLSKDLAAIKRSLSQVSIGNLPSATIDSYSLADQNALNDYIGSFHAALKRAVENHDKRGAKPSALVSCDISVGGQVTNVRLVRGSGDAEFDRKVLAGYARLRQFRAPPKGTPLIGLEVTFTQ